MRLIALFFLGTAVAFADSLEPLPTARFEFNGIIGERVEANIDAWLLRAPAANPGMLEMFRSRDRQPAPSLVPWAGEFAGKYLLSCVQALRMSARPELRRHVGEFVAQLIATQAEDGYLGPFPKGRRLLGEWDLWGHYHVMQGLVAWRDLSGEETALLAARKAADLICKTYLDGTRRVIDAGSNEMNMAVSHVLTDLHRRTGDARYLGMVREIEKDWQRAGDYARTGEKGVPFYKTPSPRWESLHDLQTLAELWRVTGEPRYREAFTSHWRSIREFDVRNSGAFSGGEQATGNAFAPTAIETCCTVAWMALSVDMLRISGDSRVADELELSMLNGALGAMHPSGRWWTYSTPMDGDRKASAHEIVFQARAGTPELNCCSVNGPRALGMLADWAVMQEEGGLVVNWHGPAKIDGGRWKLFCDSRYPLDGAVNWRLEASEAMRIKFRIPAWAAGAAVNDAVAKSGDYFSKTVNPGEIVRLKLPLTVRTIEGRNEQAGKMGILRGPVLLAYDQRDNGFDEFAIPRVDPSKPGDGVLVNVDAGNGIAPWLLVEVPTARGPLKLRDFATAGMNGTRYRSWLRTVSSSSGAKTGAGPVFRAGLRGDVAAESGRLLRSTGFTAAEDAVSLNGRDQMLIYALPERFGLGDFSVSVRVRIQSLPEKRIGQIFSAWCEANDDPLRIVVQDAFISARIEGSGGASTVGVPVAKGEWQRIAVVKEDDVLTLYVNGAVAASAAAPARVATKSRSFGIGGNPLFSGPEFLAAEFSGLVIYDRALSQEEVSAVCKD